MYSSNGRRSVFLRAIGLGMATLAISANVASEERLSIEQLLRAGWEIAGYSQAFDNRSTFILFRNPKILLGAVSCGIRRNSQSERLFDLL